MTFEELKNALDEISVTDSSSFPGSKLCLSSMSLKKVKDFIASEGNCCKIAVRGGKRQDRYRCIFLSVDNWLYFVEENDRVCLRRVSWDKVEFLDTDLIRIREDGDPE